MVTVTVPRGARAVRIHLVRYDIEKHKVVESLRKNKSVSVGPVWVLGIEVHEFVEQDMGHWGHAHGGARMADVGFVDSIDL